MKIFFFVLGAILLAGCGFGFIVDAYDTSNPVNTHECRVLHVNMSNYAYVDVNDFKLDLERCYKSIGGWKSR